MTEAVTVTNEELTILCDLVAGWRETVPEIWTEG